MSQSEAYTFNVFRYATAVVRLLQRADHSVSFIGTFPASRGLRARGISREDWLAYHYSVFCATLVSTYDCLLMLSNVVFSLGLEPRACRNDTVRDNWNLLGTDVPARLKDVETTLKTLRPIRNRLVHHAADPTWNESFELALTAEFLDGLSPEVESPDNGGALAMLRKPLRDDLLRIETRKLTRTLAAELDAVAEAAEKLFVALEGPYGLHQRLHSVAALGSQSDDK
jgi:hypothetical protein